MSRDQSGSDILNPAGQVSFHQIGTQGNIAGISHRIPAFAGMTLKILSNEIAHFKKE
jgi:hypothetical protein